MTRYLTTAALAAILGVAGCSTAPTPQITYALVPVKSNGQDLPGLDTKTTLESRQPGGIVSIRGDEQFAAFGAGFIVAVQNKSGAPVDFGPKNISASVNGKQVTVLAAEELDQRVKDDIRAYMRATNRTGIVDIEAATAEATREYRFNNFGGCPAGQSGCQIYSEDNGSGYRQDRLNREIQAENVTAAALTLQANQTLIEQRALKSATVAPEAMAGGAMVVQPPKSGGVVDITITFNGATHRFSFNAKPTV
jgi:hypothetical protein